MVEDAFDKNKKHAPIMTTADLGILYDPIYKKIAKNYLDHPKEFEKAFARAWFKLIHRDMGPVTRYLGPDVPKEQFIWQDPIPKAPTQIINSKDISQLKMTVLLGGMRVLDLKYNECQAGVLTHRKCMLTNDFFVNLLDMDTVWTPSKDNTNLYIGCCRTTGKPLWTATKADLIFGYHSQLRALAEFYASPCNEKKFLNDFISVWNKVMNADRFDVKKR